MKNAIINATSRCRRERRIGGTGKGSTGMNMRDADHDLAKGSELADRHRESRANQVLLLMSGHVNSLWAVRHFLHKTLRAIVPADVAHDTHKREHLSLERRFPSAQVGTTHGRSERIGAESGRV